MTEAKVAALIKQYTTPFQFLSHLESFGDDETGSQNSIAQMRFGVGTHKFGAEIGATLTHLYTSEEYS